MQKVLLIIKSPNLRQSGMSLVEALLAVAIFAVITTGVIGAIVYGQESSAVAGARERATKIAEEGIEAVRNIRDSGYSNLPVDGTYGLAISGGVWTLSGTSDTTDIFTRTVTLATVDSRTRNVTVNVTWTQTIQRPGSISVNTYLTNWVTAPIRNGMLVYGDGDSTTDAIKYQIYSDSAGTWSAAAATADVDTGSTNKSLRAAKLYASSTRNEKVLVSRHYNGTSQWIYAQVYNGVTNTWGNVVQLATWTAATFLDVQNFDATYMANGNLMVIYSDNTIVPKYRIWDGSTWSAQSSLTTFAASQIPSYIVARTRSGTNEIMMASFAQNSDTVSEYYSGTAWSAVTSHAATAPSATERLVDFAWSSSDATKGALVYADAGADKQMNIRIWTANGTGGGAWGATAQYGTSQSNNLGALKITEIKGTTNFIACDKDSLNPPRIICMRANTSGWVAASNVTVAAASDNGIQVSYDLGFEQTTTSDGVLVYSDNTTTPKYKKFNVGTNTWDAAATNVSPGAIGAIKTAMVTSNPITDDMMILVADANLDLYSVVWDGTNHQLFTAPTGKAWLAHGTNGSSTTDYWYDFVWDGISV